MMYLIFFLRSLCNASLVGSGWVMMLIVLWMFWVKIREWRKWGGMSMRGYLLIHSTIE